MAGLTGGGNPLQNYMAMLQRYGGTMPGQPGGLSGGGGGTLPMGVRPFEGPPSMAPPPQMSTPFEESLPQQPQPGQTPPTATPASPVSAAAPRGPGGYQAYAPTFAPQPAPPPPAPEPVLDDQPAAPPSVADALSILRGGGVVGGGATAGPGGEGLQYSTNRLGRAANAGAVENMRGKGLDDQSIANQLGAQGSIAKMLDPSQTDLETLRAMGVVGGGLEENEAGERNFSMRKLTRLQNTNPAALERMRGRGMTDQEIANHLGQTALRSKILGHDEAGKLRQSGRAGRPMNQTVSPDPDRPGGSHPAGGYGPISPEWERDGRGPTAMGQDKARELWAREPAGPTAMGQDKARELWARDPAGGPGGRGGGPMTVEEAAAGRAANPRPGMGNLRSPAGGGPRDRKLRRPKPAGKYRNLMDRGPGKGPQGPQPGKQPKPTGHIGGNVQPAGGMNSRPGRRPRPRKPPMPTR